MMGPERDSGVVEAAERENAVNWNWGSELSESDAWGGRGSVMTRVSLPQSRNVSGEEKKMFQIFVPAILRA